MTKIGRKIPEDYKVVQISIMSQSRTEKNGAFSNASHNRIFGYCTMYEFA